MKKIILITILLFFVFNFISSYYENKENRQIEIIKKEQIDKKIQVSVQDAVFRENAVTEWDSKLSKGKRYRRDPIFTNELEKVWLINNPILFVGYIHDIKAFDDDNYIISIERKHFNRGYAFRTDLQLSLVTSKKKIDKFLQNHTSLLKGGRRKSVAVIADISEIKTIYYAGEEGSREEIKVGVGHLIYIEYIGRTKLDNVVGGNH